MPGNYPPNIQIIDKSATFCNLRFDKPVQITVVYNVGWWGWLFRWLLRRRPIHQLVFASCSFLQDGKLVRATPDMIEPLPTVRRVLS